jgi:dihydroorotase
MSHFGSLGDPPATFGIIGVRVIEPFERSDRSSDLAVIEGRLADPAQLPGDAPRIDGSGLLLAPGLCDLHAHLREPGMERAETLQTGTRAAAHGGYTTVCVMPNTDPPLDEPARVALVMDRARAAAARVRVVAAATRGREGERMTEIGELADMGIVGVSDDGQAIASGRVARGLLAYLAPIGLPLIEHAEDATLAAGAVMRAGPLATRLGLTAWPASAELAIIERDIGLAEETGGWLHVTHLSTAGGLEAIRRAKGRGVHVTCDVTPHHLAMTDAWVAGDRRFAWQEPSGVGAEPFTAPIDPELAYDAMCRVNPPLSSRSDALALLGGVADGAIDAIATDHAPHPIERKAVEFAAAAPGMIGLETALSLGLAAVAAGVLTLARLLEAMSSGPAALIGEERGLGIGALADFVLFDPDATWRVGAASLASASSNTPLLGRELPGVVRLTVSGGRITYRDAVLELS